MAILQPTPTDESDVGPVVAVESAREPVDPYPSFDAPRRPAASQPRPLPQRERFRSWPMVLAGLSIALLMVLGIITMPWPTAPSGIPRALPQGGTVISIRSSNGGELAIRVPNGEVVHLSMTGKQLETRDGWVLALSSVRPSDSVTMPTAFVVVDSTQARVSLSGIVALAPEPDGSVMTVQIAPTRTVLVNIGGETRINGQLPSADSRMSIVQAGRVRSVGILDQSLDEMTQAWTIDRI